MGSKPKIGIIGLGIMGGAMATHLLDSGYEVYGYDTDAKAKTRLKKQGGKALKDVQSVGQQADILITSLPNAQALNQVVKDFTANSTRLKFAATVLIETSTLPIADKVACAKQLKSLGITALDCPITGTVDQLKNREWSIFASGPRKTYQQALQVLQALTDKTSYMGAYGSGTKMKFVANHLVAIYNVAYAESVTLARKMGLDPREVLKLFGNSPILGTGVMRSRMAMMVTRKYSPPTMKVEVWQKDMAIISDMAKSVHCPTPLFTTSADIYTAAMAQGLALEDTASTAEVLSSMAGIKRKN